MTPAKLEKKGIARNFLKQKDYPFFILFSMQLSGGHGIRLNNILYQVVESFRLCIYIEHFFYHELPPFVKLLRCFDR